MYIYLNEIWERDIANGWEDKVNQFIIHISSTGLLPHIPHKVSFTYSIISMSLWQDRQEFLKVYSQHLKILLTLIPLY